MEMRYQGEHSNHSKNSYPSPTLRSTVRTFFTWHMVAVYALRFRSISSERSVTANVCSGVSGRRLCAVFLTEFLSAWTRRNKTHLMTLRAPLKGICECSSVGIASVNIGYARQKFVRCFAAQRASSVRWLHAHSTARRFTELSVMNMRSFTTSFRFPSRMAREAPGFEILRSFASTVMG